MAKKGLVIRMLGFIVAVFLLQSSVHAGEVLK
jgi:hypothetical protein